MAESTSHNNNNNNNNNSNIHILSLADEITAEIFSFLGPLDLVARCAPTCPRWHRVSRHSRALWRRFVYQEYGFGQGDPEADWQAVYAYLYGRRHGPGGRYGAAPDPFFSQLIQSQLVFCDDGSHQPGNGPENALDSYNRSCWCTNAFVDHDVDFVADLGEPCLVTHVRIENGDFQFTAPVKEALAFLSWDLPDLDHARAFDGPTGIELAHELCPGINWDNEDLRDVRSRESRTIVPSAAAAANRHYPKAGFVFPDSPDRAFLKAIKEPVRPIVARYVHFKLLSSSKCNDRVSNNIDVCHLQTLGFPLPALEAMIYPQRQTSTMDSTNNDNTATAATTLPPDPSSRYQRHHEVREYPWHIHDDFVQQRQQQYAQLHRLLQVQAEHEQTRQRLQQQVADQLEENRRAMEVMQQEAQDLAGDAAQAVAEQLERQRQMMETMSQTIAGMRAGRRDDDDLEDDNDEVDDRDFPNGED